MIMEILKENKSASAILGFVLFFVLFCIFFNLGGRTLENQDNMNFAEVGREILETGDWVMMRLGGNIYVDKPPLHFWNIALSYKLFGVSPFAARVPSAFFAALGLVGILLFCFQVQRETPTMGIYACLFLFSNYAYSYYSRTARIDMEYSVLFSLSLISFYTGYETKKPGRKALFYSLFWVLMGMAFLSKGPVAFVPLVIALIYLLIRRNWGSLRFGILIATSPLLIITILPWVILLAVHKDFDRYLYLLRTSTIMTRREGFFYYFPSLFINFLPGTLFMAISLPFLWRWRDEVKKHPGVLFCLTWSTVYFLIIHLTAAKNLRYLLPLFLPLSVITAWVINRLFREGILSHKVRKYWRVSAGILAGLISLAPAVWIFFNRGFAWNALLLSVVSISSLFFASRKAKDVVVFTCVLCALGFLSLDLLRTAFNTRLSDNLQLFTVLKDHNVGVDDIVLYKTGRDTKWTLGFYYNKLLRQKDVLENEDHDKAIVTSPMAVDEVFKVFGADRQTAIIRSHRGAPEPNYCAVFPLLHR